MIANMQSMTIANTTAAQGRDDMKQIDIIDIKQAVAEGRITVCVQNGKIFLENTAGERVKIGEAKEDKPNYCPG